MAAEGFNASEVSSFRTMFDSCDADKSGKLDHEEVQVLMRKSGEEVGFARVGEIIAQIDKNNDGQVDFKEFLGCMRVIKSGASSIGGASSPMTKVFKSGALYQTKGEGGAMHSISEDERDAFAGHINLILGSDVFLQDRLPMDPTDPNALFEVCKDGILLAKLVNKVEPGTVDERALNLKAKLSKFQQIENCNLAINAAKAIGCKLVNIGATNLLDGTEHLILGVCWQIIRKTLLSNISIKNHPELFRLLEDDESLEKLGRLPPEQILMRWVNFQLKRAESSRIITNFGSDLKDCEVYSQLLHQLDPARCPLVTTGTNEVKAPKILENVTAMGLQPFLKANDIVSGNSKLNLGMVAQIFNANPGLAEVTIEEQEELEANFAALVVDDNSGDTREERTFRMWINSLNLDGVREEDGTVFINDLYFGLADGFTILRLMDRIQPGIVNWKRVHKNPKGRIHAVDNCNTVVTLAKQMDLVVVNIGGSDLCDGNKKLVLAVMWQLMRRFTLDMLKALSTDGAVTEKTLVDWANAKVQEAKPEAGSPPKPARIRNLNDKGLADATFLLLLCSAVAPRTVDWSLGALGDGDQKSNAQYAISVARKIGACVFLSPEDITEVKPKMLFSFIAAIKLVALQGGQPALASADASSAAAEEPSSGPSPPKPPPPAAPAAAAAAAAVADIEDFGGRSSNKPRLSKLRNSQSKGVKRVATSLKAKGREAASTQEVSGKGAAVGSAVMGKGGAAAVVEALASGGGGGGGQSKEEDLRWEKPAAASEVALAAAGHQPRPTEPAVAAAASPPCSPRSTPTGTTSLFSSFFPLLFLGSWLKPPPASSPWLHVSGGMIMFVVAGGVAGAVASAIAAALFGRAKTLRV